MYTYLFRCPTGTTSSTAGTLLPFFSIQAGARAVRLRGIKFDTTYGNVLYALVVRRGSEITTGGSTLTPFNFTLDPIPSPLFAPIYSASGVLNPVNTFATGDKEVFLHASNPIGQTEWEDGDITSVSLNPNDKGSLDIYVGSPAASANFVMSVFVEEGRFKGELDLAGANTSAIKSR